MARVAVEKDILFWALERCRLYSIPGKSVMKSCS